MTFFCDFFIFIHFIPSFLLKKKRSKRKLNYKFIAKSYRSALSNEKSKRKLNYNVTVAIGKSFFLLSFFANNMSVKKPHDYINFVGRDVFQKTYYVVKNDVFSNKKFPDKL